MNTDTFKLITPLEGIPEGATITKKTGEKKYTVKSNIRVRTDPNDQTKTQEIKAEPGARLIVSSDGFISALGSKTEVVWHASANDLQELIDPPDGK